MVGKKIAGWIVIYRSTTKTQPKYKKEGFDKLKNTYENRKIPDFLKDKNKTFLPLDVNCHLFHFGAKTLLLSKEKCWFQCKEEKFEQNKTNDSCVICLDNFEENKHIVSLICGHSFHKGCLIKWINRKRTCPLCLVRVLTKTIKTKPTINYSMYESGNYSMADTFIPSFF